MSARQLRVIVADDHALVRAGFRSIQRDQVDTSGGLRKTATASSSHRTLRFGITMLLVMLTIKVRR